MFPRAASGRLQHGQQHCQGSCQLGRRSILFSVVSKSSSGCHVGVQSARSLTKDRVRFCQLQVTIDRSWDGGERVDIFDIVWVFLAASDYVDMLY